MNQEDRYASIGDRLRGVLRNGSEAISKLFRDRSDDNRLGDVKINGQGNIVGNVVNVQNTTTHTPRPKVVVVNPGFNAISARQAAELQELVRQIAKNSKASDKPVTIQRVWWQLCKAMEVTSYREIPLDKFERAKRYLSKWLSNVSSDS